MEALSVITEAIDAYFDQIAHQNKINSNETQHNSTSDVEITEHALIQHLSSQKIAPFNTLDIKHSQALFSAHFLCKHALYHLQNNYLNQATYILDITLTKLIRKPYQHNSASLSYYDSVKEYYLDIRHYFETSEAEVNDLLTNFWTKFLAQGDKTNALLTLELPHDANYLQVKKQYRLLAQKHHPDKGGSHEAFSKINAAKQVLDRIFR